MQSKLNMQNNQKADVEMISEDNFKKKKNYQQRSSISSEEDQRYQSNQDGDAQTKNGFEKNDQRQHQITSSILSSFLASQNETTNQKQEKSAKSRKNNNKSLSRSKKQKSSQKNKKSISSSNKPVENRDHCNYCKDGGDLICCDNCPRSFHIETCLQKYCQKNNLVYEEVPLEDDDSQWYCPRCKPIVEKRNQENLDKLQRMNEKDQAYEERKRKMDEEQRIKNEEFEKKRLEKRQEKEKQEQEKIKLRDEKNNEIKKAREEKERRIQEEKEEKKRQLEEEKRLREEKAAEEKRLKQEKLEAEKKARMDKQELETKRKQDAAEKKELDRLTRIQELEKQKQERESERALKENEKKEAKDKYKQESQENQKDRETSKTPGVQTVLPFSKSGEQKKKIIVLSQAEIEKIKLQNIIKAQLEVFKRYFPNLVEKNSIKYPIEDKLILLMPELHGQMNLKKVPNLKQVQNIESEDFENLIYLWEFFNNFNDFLNLPSFSLSELQAAMNFHQICGGIDSSEERIHTAFQQEQLDSSQEITNDPFQGYQWHQKCTIIEIRENGFNLINQIHQALINAIIKNLDIMNKNGDGASAILSGGLQNLNQQNSRSTRQTDPSGNGAWTGQKNNSSSNANLIPEDYENGILINSIISLGQNNNDKLWTELVRLLIIHADERLEIEIESMKDYNQMSEILKKVGSLSPQQYTFGLTYKEKIDLLMFLVDTIHDLDTFRQFLNKRAEERTNLFKQKNDFHAEIKKIEQEKNDFIQEQKQKNSDEQDKILKKIDDLNEKLLSATRVESKFLNQKIQDLKKELNISEETLQRFEDKILKKHQKIEKLVEQYHSLNIKTTVLGVDQKGSEYWHFKDDNSKIFIKKNIQVPCFAKYNHQDNLINSQQIYEKKSQFVWFYLDEEEEFEDLIESFNIKGILEKKLVENLKKIRTVLKLRKTKSLKNQEQNESDLNKDQNLENQIEFNDQNLNLKKRQEDKDMTASEQDDDSQIKQNHSKKNQGRDDNNDQSRHHLFFSDEFEEAIISSVWFSKTIPRKKKNDVNQNYNMNTRRGRQTSFNEQIAQQHQLHGGVYESKDINLKEMKNKLMDIEQQYSIRMQNSNREWDSQDERDKVLKELQECEDIDEFYRIIQLIEKGFCDPFQVTYKKVDVKEQQESSDEEEKQKSTYDPKDQQNSEMIDENQQDDLDKSNIDDKNKNSKFCEQKGDMLIKRRKIQMFKFWPKPVVRSAWQKYVSAGESGENINAAYLALQLLEKALNQYLLNLSKKEQQKAQKIGQNQDRQDQMKAMLQDGNRRQTSQYAQNDKNINNGVVKKSQYGRVTKPLVDYKKYLGSSSDEMDYISNNHSDNLKGRRTQKDAEIAKSRSGRRLRGGYKNLNQDDDEEISEVESQDQQEDNEDDFDDDEFNDRSHNKSNQFRRNQKSNQVSNVNTGQRTMPNMNYNQKRSRRQASSSTLRNQENDLYERYGYKSSGHQMSNVISRSERAKMRNQRKGYEQYDEDNSVSQNKGKSNQYSNNDDITDMRDDEIAEMNQDDDY